MKNRLENELGERLVALHTGAKGLRGQMTVEVTVPRGAQGDCLDVCASDETLDRYNEVIQASGWVLDHYAANPVIQNCHQYGDIIYTIGKALRTEVAGGRLRQRWQFASDANPMAKIAYGLYRGGYLNAASVGFIPLEWRNGAKTGEPARVYTRQELLEVSAVGIPANPNALVMALKSGAVEQSDLRELAQVLKHFCNDTADPAANARATGCGANAAQWLQLTQIQKNIQAILRRA
jgi:HK97 family phage prohead protease